jgi:hypothetical protein
LEQDENKNGSGQGRLRDGERCHSMRRGRLLGNGINRMHASPAQPQTISYIIGGAMLLLVLVLRFRSVGRQRRLRLELMWILPAFLVAVAGLVFITAPPSPTTLGLCALTLLMGAALGWQRGRMMQISVNPETHELNQVSSLAAMLFLVAIIAMRFGARALIDSGILPVQANPMAVSDVLISFAVGMFGVMRVEMFLRARRLLAEVRAGR